MSTDGDSGINLDEGDNDEKEEDKGVRDRDVVTPKPSEKTTKPPIKEPKISFLDKTGLAIRDGLNATAENFSEAVSGTGKFIKATGRSLSRIISGKFNQIRTAFVETLKEDEYDPQDDPRIPEELKDHRYEEIHIRLATKDGAPLVGANLTLLSEPRHAETDDSGRAVFSDVPIGEHTLKIAFGIFRGEQAIFLKDDSPKVLVAVTPNLSTGVNTGVYVISLILVAILFVVGGYYFGRLRKRKGR